VTERTFGEVAALDTFSERTLSTLPHVEHALDAYHRALNAALEAPSELTIDLDDRRAEGVDLVATLAGLDQVPAAFAFALRELDGGDLPLRGIRSTHNHQAAAAFAVARMDHPFATPAEVRELANGREPLAWHGGPVLPIAGRVPAEVPPVLERPPASGDEVAEEVVHWLGVTSTVTGAAGSYLEAREAASALAAHDGRGAGVRGVSGASRAVGVAKHVSGYTGAVLPVVEQHLADAGDHNLTTGQRSVRAVGAALIDTPLGGIGAAAGVAVGGALTLQPAGAAAGGVVGGGMGAAAGGSLRRTRAYRTIAGGLARGVDWVLGTGHDDDYTDRLGLGTPP
jgi:hypothetical protein